MLCVVCVCVVCVCVVCVCVVCAFRNSDGGLLLQGLLIMVGPLMGDGPGEYMFVSPHITNNSKQVIVWRGVRVGKIMLCVVCVVCCMLCVVCGLCVC